MLLGKYLCRCHDAGLAAVVDGNEHHHECYERLAAADVPLQQSVHLPAALHVGMHLADDTFLCFRQRKWQVLVEESVECLADTREALSHAFLLSLAGIGHDDELDEEQFLEFQPHVGSSKLVGCAWIVCSSKCFIKWHKMQPFSEILRQRFRNCEGEFAEEGTREVFQRARRHACLLHALRRGVIGLHAHFTERHRFGFVEVWMNDAQSPSIYARTAEKDIVLAYLYTLLYVFDALKPRNVEEHVAIPEMPS